MCLEGADNLRAGRWHYTIATSLHEREAWESWLQVGPCSPTSSLHPLLTLNDTAVRPYIATYQIKARRLYVAGDERVGYDDIVGWKDGWKVVNESSLFVSLL